MFWLENYLQNILFESLRSSTPLLAQQCHWQSLELLVCRSKQVLVLMLGAGDAGVSQCVYECASSPHVCVGFSSQCSSFPPTIGAVCEWLYCPVSVPEQKTEEGLNQVPGHWPAAAQPLQSTHYTVHYVCATEKVSFWLLYKASWNLCSEQGFQCS